MLHQHLIERFRHLLRPPAADRTRHTPYALPAPRRSFPPRPAASPPASERPRIGLALGGGALRGAAHIGVLRVLEEEGIPIDLIAGTSAGALAGLLYASGMSPCEMEAMAHRLRFRQIFRWTVPRMTLWDIGPMARTLEHHVGKECLLEGLHIPLACVAADARSGEAIALKRGPAISAVQASCAIPMLVRPVVREGRTLLDGSVAQMVPARAAREMGADLVIAAHMSGSKFMHTSPGNLMESLVHGVKMVSHRLCQSDLEHADIVIRAEMGMHRHHISSIPAFIRAGEAAARDALPRIQAHLDQWHRRAERPVQWTAPTAYWTADVTGG